MKTIQSTICVDTLRVMYQPRDLKFLLNNSYYSNNINECLIKITKHNKHKTLKKYYHNVFKISIVDNGFEFFVGYLAFGEKQFGSENIKINYDKSFLYKENFTYYINLLQKHLDLKLNNITRLDIAFDINKDIIKRVFRLSNNNDYYLMSLRKEINSFVGAYTYNKVDKTYNNSLYIVSNNNTLCMYDKTTQMKNNWYNNSLNDKCVNDYHSKIFDPNDKINRVEIRLYGGSFTKHRKSTYNDKETIKNQIDIDLLRLENKDFLYTLFEEKLNNILSFRVKDNNYKNKKYWLSKKKSIVDLKYKKVDLTSTSISIERKSNNDISKIKETIQEYFNRRLTQDVEDKYFNDLIKENHLENDFYDSLIKLNKMKKL